MPNTFFTADTHFGHANIIKLCARPFSSVEEMDEVLIERWNERVGHEDTVYHLGDFAFKSMRAREIFGRLNGRYKILITGNHDGPDVTDLPWYHHTGYALLQYEDTPWLALFHYPMVEWDGWYKGNIHLHGHQHNKEPLRAERRVDVGVDANAFRPWALEEIRALVA